MLAGVDEVGVFVAAHREWADAEHAWVRMRMRVRVRVRVRARARVRVG